MDQLLGLLLPYVNASLFVGLLIGYLALRRRGAAVFVAVLYAAVLLIDQNSRRSRLDTEEFVSLAAGLALGALVSALARRLSRK
jgi:hypothetical protein